MIAQAALRFRGDIWTLPRPARHHHLLWVMNQVLGWDSDIRAVALPLHDEHRIEQGFVDEEGTFFDRKHAAAHAVACSQIVAPQWPPNLYSEDMW